MYLTIMNSDNTSYWLLYKGVRHCLGYWKAMTLKRLYLEWMAENGYGGACAICGGKVTHSKRSIDHIIPVSVCYELNMPGLVFDKRNFQRAHIDCNLRRGNKLDDVSGEVLAKLRNMGYHLNS